MVDPSGLLNILNQGMLGQQAGATNMLNQYPQWQPPPYYPQQYGVGMGIPASGTELVTKDSIATKLILDDAECNPDGYQPPKPKIVETDEFKKLYNHKFHELLDEFEELRSKVT